MHYFNIKGRNKKERKMKSETTTRIRGKVLNAVKNFRYRTQLTVCVTLKGLFSPTPFVISVANFQPNNIMDKR